MINAVHLTKDFGQVKAVSDISFEVKEGETLVLVGTSGCGKTTTLKMINRLIEPTSGSIMVNGADVTRQSPETLRRGIGYVLQHNSLFPHYTVAENIAVVPELLKWDKKKIKSRTEELIDKLRLPQSYYSCYPHELSGGQQQRVNIARAIAADPPILLMDEPFGALDTITRTTIRKEFGELDELKRKTVVMVTHDVQEAFELGDRICLMDKGEIIQAGKPLELLFHPVNSFVKEFLSEAYLELALKSIKVQDIWPELSNSDLEETSGTRLSADQSLWEIMQFAVKNKEDRFVSIRNNKGETRHIMHGDLFKFLHFNHG